MVLNNIQFTYQRQDSVLHRMDTISKLLLVAIVSIAVYFFKNPIQILPFPFLLFFLALVLGRIKPSVAFWSFMVFVTFGLFVAFFQLVSHQAGETLFNFLFLNVTPEGLRMAEIFVLRLSTIGSAALVFLWTTNPKFFATALVYMKVPYRFAFAVLVALRFLPMIQDEITKIKDAHLIRGIKQEKGLKGSFQSWQRYLFPILVNGLRKSETTSIAMDSRGFGLYPTRVYVDEFKWSLSGIVLVVCVFALVCVLGYLWGFGFVQPRYNAMLVDYLTKLC